MVFLSELRAQEWTDATAYAALDEAERETDEGTALLNAISDSSDLYSLYDVDKDGVPELFIRFGDCEAAYHSKCYTFRNGEITLVGDFPSGHSSLARTGAPSWSTMPTWGMGRFWNTPWKTMRCQTGRSCLPRRKR